MKWSLIFASSILFGFLIFGSRHNSHADGQPPRLQSEEFERLKTTYLKKRSDALKPVTGWYETQLESLRKKLTQKGDLEGALLLKAEQESMKETANEDDENFRKAIVVADWNWSDLPDGTGAVKTTFHRDPLVTHPGLNGNWRITGPREVTINHVKENQIIVLSFDKNVTTFQGVLRTLNNGNSSSHVYGKRVK